ncbi:MAG: glycosyltransferase family 4 protein, partial [Chitinophagaceae bacterium]
AQDPISAFVVRQLFKDETIITTCHYNDDPVSELQQNYELTKGSLISLKAAFRKFFNAPDQFICVSEYVAEKSRFFIPEKSKVSIVHNAVDFQTIKQERGIKRNDKLIITNCGTLEDRKNQVLLIEVAKDLVSQNYLSFEIWLIGTGPNFHSYKKLIQDYGLGDVVKLLGWIPKPWKVISQSGLYIHTATNEAFGYTIIEAIAAGTYSLAIDTGAIQEVLGDEGLVSQSGARKTFLDLIMNIDLNLLEGKAQRQYERASHKFSISAWRDKHSNIYRQKSVHLSEIPVL